MSGRASRARLLAPSFLVVATAIACGQTSGSPEEGGQGSSPTVGTSGDAGVGATGGGGTGMGATGTGATGVTGGYAGSCGGSCNPPAPSTCPPTPPQQGAFCIGSVMCQYGPDAAPAGCPAPSNYASCLNGAWNVSVSVTSCNPPPVLTCPPTLPTPDSPCGGINVNGVMCTYPGRSCASESAWCPHGTWKVSACSTGAGGAGGAPSFGGEPSVSAGAGGQGGAP